MGNGRKNIMGPSGSWVNKNLKYHPPMGGIGISQGQ